MHKRNESFWYIWWIILQHGEELKKRVKLSRIVLSKILFANRENKNEWREREKKMNYGWFTQNNIMENKKRKKRGYEENNEDSKKKYFVEAAPNHPSASLQINAELKNSIKNSSLKKIRVSLGGILNLPQVMKCTTLPENLHVGKYIIIICCVCVFNHRKTFPVHLFAEMNWSN